MVLYVDKVGLVMFVCKVKVFGELLRVYGGCIDVVNFFGLYEIV